MPNESSNSGSYKYTGSGTNSQVSGLVDLVCPDYSLTYDRAITTVLATMVVRGVAIITLTRA